MRLRHLQATAANADCTLVAVADAATGRVAVEQDHCAGGWEIHGKTGAGFPVLPDGRTDHAHGQGWFVGWAIKGGRAFVFVRQTQDGEPHDEPAGLARATPSCRACPRCRIRSRAIDSGDQTETLPVQMSKYMRQSPMKLHSGRRNEAGRFFSKP